MKVLRYLILAIVGLVLLAVAAVAVAIFVIDPNTYRPQIERVVEQNTNLELNLRGDIGWSLFPLGIELNEVEATLEGEPLLSLERLVAQVDFWSLIAMAPKVHTFVLDGLDARLVMDENGNGNWTRIMPEGAAADDAGDTPPATAAETGDESSGELIDFNVEEVRITNARVQYDDLGTGQTVVLQDFELLASQITLGSEFPLEVSFEFNTNDPELTVTGDINMRLSANQELDNFSVAGLDARFGLAGEHLPRAVQARLTGGLRANLTEETANLSNFRATLANLELSTDLNVRGFGDRPQLDGRIRVAEFSLRELLRALGMDEPVTADTSVLTRLGLSATLGGPAGTVELSELVITLDDTLFNGGGRYNLDTGALAFNLAGDALNADRYLPPGSDEPAQASAPAAEEGDLLPLETVRELDLNLDFDLGELIISNLTITDINTEITANGGQLRLRDFSGQLYEGGFQSSVTIDARTDNPAWAVGMQVSGVETQPLLTDLAEMDMLAGAANLNVNVNTRGNRISNLRSNAGGEIGFRLDEGQFTRMNLTRMACQGIALVNQESLATPTSEWGGTTPFNDMRGTLKINGNTITNDNLVAALAGMRLEGNGKVDMEASRVDYELGLRIVGEIHRDQACRVSQVVQNAVIPVECRGNFVEDPAGLCSFDGSRFRDTLATIAANAARARVQEETDRARERVEERARSEVDRLLNRGGSAEGEEGSESQGSGDGDRLRDALRGLINR